MDNLTRMKKAVKDGHIAPYNAKLIAKDLLRQSLEDQLEFFHTWSNEKVFPDIFEYLIPNNHAFLLCPEVHEYCNNFIKHNNISPHIIKTLVDIFPEKDINEYDIDSVSSIKSLRLLMSQSYAFANFTDIFSQIYIACRCDSTNLSETDAILQEFCEYICKIITHTNIAKSVSRFIARNIKHKYVVGYDVDSRPNSNLDFFLCRLLKYTSEICCIDVFSIGNVKAYIPYFFSNKMNQTIQYLLDSGLDMSHINLQLESTPIHNRIKEQMLSNGISECMVGMLNLIYTLNLDSDDDSYSNSDDDSY